MKMLKTTRRDFLKTTALGTAAMTISGCSQEQEDKVLEKQPLQSRIPRWRGFNLMSFFFTTSSSPYAIGSSANDMTTREEDFQWIAELGFDFVRLPMSYPLLLDRTYKGSDKIQLDDIYKIKESSLDKVDRTVEQAQKYGIHLNLNLHRAPGFCVNEELTEPFDLWTSQEAYDAFIFYWDIFAKRYSSIPASQLSFNLVNEPYGDEAARETYIRLANDTAEKMWEQNPDRLVFVDAFRANRNDYAPLPELNHPNIVQSARGYSPGYLTHYQAPWAGNQDAIIPPEWPGNNNGEYWDRARLEKYYQPWIDLARKGQGVHCGEFGCWNKTPHNVVQAFFKDLLDILTENNIGYALWNFRHEFGFGILDSDRADVQYEDWRGHKLDRKLLDLLLQH